MGHLIYKIKSRKFLIIYFMVQSKFEPSRKSVMSTLVVILLVSTFSFPHTLGNPVDIYDDYHDIYNSGLVMNESDTSEYNDTLLESLLDSPYFRGRSDKNWRYSFSEDLDMNNDSVVSKDEISSPSLDLNAATDLATFYFDIAPDRYYWTYYDLMQMRYVDDNNDAFLSTQEIENALRVTTDDQKEIIRELFTYFDENNDNKLSMDDLKPKLNTLLTILFKIYDQDNDGLLSLEDMDFKIQWDDITSILSTIKEKYMPNGEIDLNHFLLPFELDLNGDGTMNNLDLYLSWNSWRDYSSFGPVAKILKLLDQNQDGIYKYEDIKFCCHYLEFT